MSSRPAWFIERVPEQLGLHRKTLCRGKRRLFLFNTHRYFVCMSSPEEARRGGQSPSLELGGGSCLLLCRWLGMEPQSFSGTAEPALILFNCSYQIKLGEIDRLMVKSSDRREPQLRKCLHPVMQARGAFSQLVNNAGRPVYCSWGYPGWSWVL